MHSYDLTKSRQSRSLRLNKPKTRRTYRQTNVYVYIECYVQYYKPWKTQNMEQRERAYTSNKIQMPENSQMFHTLCSKKIRDANPKGSFTYRLSKVLKILKPESFMHHTSMKDPVQSSDQDHRTIYYSFKCFWLEWFNRSRWKLKDCSALK